MALGMVAKSHLCYIILNFIRFESQYLQSSSVLLCVCGFTSLEPIVSEQFKVQTQSCERKLLCVPVGFYPWAGAISAL